MTHNCSYMVDVDPTLCSVAFIIRCTATVNEASGSVVEITEDADNYRVEILGGMMLQQVLCAASQNGISSLEQPTLGHGNSPTDILPNKQKQADMLQYCNA